MPTKHGKRVTATAEFQLMGNGSVNFFSLMPDRPRQYSSDEAKIKGKRAFAVLIQAFNICSSLDYPAQERRALESNIGFYTLGYSGPVAHPIAPIVSGFCSLPDVRLRSTALFA